MVTNGSRIFITSIQTNYVSTLEQISQTQNFLTINLDLPENIWLVLEDIRIAE